ncbi:CHAT domain-containing protein [Spirosoma spitsbergense]|uniref:CHAT domain-containing protein n=1 Tax=Spirosoma spitsbergense TaxID=431554 RepID=UPI0012FAFC99|nr:CHAT domain-containing tetratricopeptide repeat protein [Spirosoma spitsbergense]
MNSRSACWLLLLLLGLPRLAWAQASLSDKYRQQAENYATAELGSERLNDSLAIVYYQKAYALVRHIDPVRAANLCVDLSSMDYKKKNTRQATDRCLMGLRHISPLHTAPDSVRFKLFSALGTFYKALYRNDSALFYFRKADLLLTRNPRIEQEIPLYVLYHFNNQGNWFFKLGNYSRSLSYLAQARQLAGKWEKPEEITYIESNMAGCYEAMGRFDEALVHRKFVNTHYQKPDIQKYMDLSGIGSTLCKLKRYHEALPYFLRAEQLLTTVRQKKKATDYLPNQLHLWRMMSSCYRAMNQLPVSDRYVQQALQLHRQYLGSKGPLLAQVLIEQGALHEDRHQYEQAAGSYQKAIQAVCRDTTTLVNYQQNPSAETASDETTLLLAATHKAVVLKKQYDATHREVYRKASVDTYSFCVGLQQRIRHGIDTDQSQVIFSTRQHALVPEAVAVTFDAYQHQPGAALRETLFQLFEQAQAGSLREAFRLNTIKPQTIPAPLLEREQRLKKQISELKKHPVTDTAAATKLIGCQLQWHRLIDTFRLDYPAYYRLNYADVAMSSRALQQQLGNQAAYVAYVRHGASLFILVATRQTIEFIRQPIDSTRFDQQLRALSQELYHDPVIRQYKGAAYAAGLYAACIAPIRVHLAGKTRLIISRDWSFNFLPFEVLETGEQARDYLTRHVAIAYAFSAQTFFAASQRPSSLNPVLVVAPFARTEAIQQAVNRQETVPTLASSEAEARRIGGDVLAGPDATVGRFLKTDLNRPVIYFATHAQTDETDPANSHIAFYPGEADKLYTDDVYNLPLGATGLAVLGACETGSGQTIRGEGILSLARAFAYAGCPSVITTLWKANEETTSFLTIRLHHHLSRGLATDQALQQARLDFFASPVFAKYDHPYYWANYILLGNYNPVMPDNSRLSMAGWLLLAVSTGLLAFWQRKRLVSGIFRLHTNDLTNS